MSGVCGGLNIIKTERSTTMSTRIPEEPASNVPEKEGPTGKISINEALMFIKDPKMYQCFERLLQKTSIEQETQQTIEDTKQQILSDAKKAVTQAWLPACPMPTDLCRVSPFFPMNRNELKERVFIEEMVIMKSSWGEIQFYGPKLSTYEEDVFMAILALFNDIYKKTETTNNQTTYTYKGPFYPLLKLVKGPKPSKTEYGRVYRALKLLNVSGFNLVICKDNKVQKEQLLNILSYAEWDHNTKELKIILNPYFYETYIKGNFTLIEIEQRMRLTSPIAKAIHRFILSHRDNTWQGHFLTLAAALNLNIEQPAFEIRRLIKLSIGQLIKENILTNKSKFIYQDIVKLDRNPEVVERKKSLKSGA
jgi:hypothetical protein